MFKKLTFILILALLLSTAWAQNSYHEVQVVDERGVNVTDISSVEIYAPDTTTNATIYADRGNQNAIEIPITTTSDNTTLSNGFLSWYGPDGYDFSITDGTNIATNATHRTRTSSEGTLVFPSFLTSITTSQYLDTESIQFGTSPDWTVNAGATANLITWTPTVDNAEFRIGVSGTSLNATFNVYTGSAIGLAIDSSVPSFAWTGGAANINASSNFTTNINTGTSSGAVNIGNSASGAVAIDGSSTGSLSVDGDLTLASTAGSVIVNAAEAATDAVNINATGTIGGIDADTTNGAIALTAGGAAHGSITMTAASAGTDAVSIASTGTNGGIALDTTAGGIVFTTAGGQGSVTISATSRIQLASSYASADAFDWNATGTNGGFDVDTTNGGFVVTTAGGAGSVTFTSAGQTAFTSTYANNAAFDLNVTGHHGGFDVDTTAGPIALTAASAAHGSVAISVAGTHTAAVNVDVTGTGGGYDLDTTAGPVAITAGGGSTGSVTITSGNGTVITASAGSVTITATGSVQGGLVFSAGNDYTLATTDDAILTIGDDYSNTVTGDYTLAVSGSTTFDNINFLREIYVVDVASTTVTAAMSGTVFHTNYTGASAYNLPTAAAGLTYTFTDPSAAAGDDVIIYTGNGDRIGLHPVTATAGVQGSLTNDYDEAGTSTVTIIGADATDWVILPGSGTWAAQ